MEARATKSSDEIERIRQMGVITTAVVQKTLDLLTSHQVVDETLTKPDGQPLTIGDVKAQINLWLAEAGAENPESTIFAIGRDGAVPHSSGTPTDPIKLGQAIVYDIFPCEAGGATSTISPAPGAWVMPPKKSKKLMIRSKKFTIQSYPN